MDIWTARTRCLMCGYKDVSELFQSDQMTALSFAFYDTPRLNAHLIPFNVLECRTCGTYQTKYLGNLSMIYEKNHVDTFGTVKAGMHEGFSRFVSKNADIDGILEVGPSTDCLAMSILGKCDGRVVYSVTDPDFRGDRERIRVYDNFIEAIDLDGIYGNTIVMSNLFEHLYDPPGVIEKIQRHSKNKYIYLNHPNLEDACKNYVPIILNIEHTFYVDNAFLVELFRKFGYSCVEQEMYSTHSIFMKFERTHAPLEMVAVNATTMTDVPRYYVHKSRKVAAVNKLVDEFRTVYMWPASCHTVDLFACGLQFEKLAGLLDNSPLKINKYCYGYDVRCFDFKDVLRNATSDTVVILGGTDCYLKELDLSGTDARIVYLRDL